jgi:hypothetical protein
MTQTVNINGQELELEQCVIDGDELDDVISICGNTLLYPNGDVVELLDTEMDDYITQVIEVPEDEQFIKEYIDSNLDSQIDDQVFNKLLEELDKDPEVMPSYKKYEDWYPTYVNGEDSLGAQEGYKFYLEKYRKELREWWMTKSKRYITNDQGDVLMSNGLPVSQADIDASNTVKDIVSNSINKPIDKEIIS